MAAARLSSWFTFRRSSLGPHRQQLSDLLPIEAVDDFLIVGGLPADDFNAARCTLRCYVLTKLNDRNDEQAGNPGLAVLKRTCDLS